jgi:glyceraldehyde-3-phosphate dehydrogenase/erythrose-4-phosphate dehydrogenase
VLLKCGIPKPARFKKYLTVLRNKFNDKNKKGKKQVKKVITFNPSRKDFTLDIVIRLIPEKYKPIEEIVSNANCFNVVCVIIGGNYKIKNIKVAFVNAFFIKKNLLNSIYKKL